MKNYPYALPQESNLIEFVDKHDNPLMVMSEEQIKLQHLTMRKVYVILRDNHGRILFVHSHKQEHLNILSTVVYAGEAREYAALRLIKQIITLKNPFNLNLDAHEIKTLKHCTFFALLIDDEEKMNLSKKAFWLDLDEIKGFVIHFSYMLGAEILQLIELGYLQNLFNIPASTMHE